MNYCKLEAWLLLYLKKLLHLAWVKISWNIKVLLLTEVCRIYLELILNWSDCLIRSWDLWRRLVGTIVLLCYFYSCWAIGNYAHKQKKRHQRSVVMFTSWLQINFRDWKLSDTFRKTGKSWLLNGAGCCLQWLWEAARGLSLRARIGSSWLGRLWTALTSWQMKMMAKHNKDDNLMSRAE